MSSTISFFYDFSFKSIYKTGTRRKNILANMAQQDNPYEDQDIWNDLSEAGSEIKNVFNEMTNNYFTENSFLSAVGNLMKSWIHGNRIHGGSIRTG